MENPACNKEYIRIKPEKMELLAAKVHEAVYMDFYRKLVGDGKFLPNPPYWEVDEGFKAISRAAVRAVLHELDSELRYSADRSLRAEECWRAAVNLMDHYKKALGEAVIHIKKLENDVESQGLVLKKRYRDYPRDSEDADQTTSDVLNKSSFSHEPMACSAG